MIRPVKKLNEKSLIDSFNGKKFALDTLSEIESDAKKWHNKYDCLFKNVLYGEIVANSPKEKEAEKIGISINNDLDGLISQAIKLLPNYESYLTPYLHNERFIPYGDNSFKMIRKALNNLEN